MFIYNIYKSISNCIVKSCENSNVKMYYNHIAPVSEYRHCSTDICTICIDELSSLVRTLPCGHLFHKNCIDVWILEKHGKCPNCNSVVLYTEHKD